MADLYALVKIPAEGEHRIATKSFPDSDVNSIDVDGIALYTSTKLSVPTGVGISDPIASLHLVTSGPSLTTPVSPHTDLIIQNNDLATDFVIISLIAGSSSNVQISLGSDGNEVACRFIYNNVNDTLDIRTANSTRVTLGKSDSDLEVNGPLALKESPEPPDPADGTAVTWISNGSGLGTKGDFLMKGKDDVGTMRFITIGDISTGSPV